ncbi:MAG: cytochrome oxidase subunit III [Chloroflexota bacterium]
MSRDEKFQLAGWVLFVICAVLYIIAGWESRSWSSLAGSVVFLLACFVFMVPLIWK